MAALGASLIFVGHFAGTLYSVQCTVYSVQCTVYIVVCGVWCVVCGV